MILATGAHGMLGGYFPGSVIKTDLPDMDITNLDLVRSIFAQHSPKHVLHLAAWTDVDGAENQEDAVFRTNAIGTLHVATAAREIGAELTYISTTQVFDGTKTSPYTEFDPVCPVNVYAAGKCEGERIVRETTPRHYIFRAGWMMGGGAKDHKFVGKIFDLLKTRDHIMAVDDNQGSPTYAKDLAAGIMGFIGTGLYGTYHMVNGGGTCSRYEMALEIARVVGSDTRIEAVTSDRFPLPAPRGANEGAVNYKLDLMERNPMRDWKSALQSYVREELLSGAR